MKKPWNNFFTPEDFSMSVFSESDKEFAANRANAKLAREVEKWPVLYATKAFKDNIITKWTTESQIDDIHGINWATHQARLAFVEPIVKPECKHEPEQVFITTHTDHSGFVTHLAAGFKCRCCGVKLKRVEVWSAE